MKSVFISWSGSPSKEIAECLARNLPFIVPEIRCFQSSGGIDKGARWSSEIAVELEGSDLGLICLTEQNAIAPWVLFEAGALSKSVANSKVVPLLFGIGPSNLAGGPLSQFQAAVFGRAEFKSVCDTLLEDADDEAKEKSKAYFDKFWPDIEAEISSALEETIPRKRKRPDPQARAIDEILGVQKFIASKLSRPGELVPYGVLVRAMIEAISTGEESEGKGAALIDHIDSLEEMLSDIASDVEWVSGDDLDELAECIERIQVVLVGFYKWDERKA